MSNLNSVKIPKEAIQTLKIIEELLDRIVVGVYLFGSAVWRISIWFCSSRWLAY